ncbi:hypothetical protein B9Z55_005239 [Caenorhabditis nigoni]|uniref:Uncharacterized protein n=1 Tax=Caenorhabditis nigoni TaxID=1611254 RepID=A0A2G5UZZ7_9PELO|nr:hypothetical protein B9Z55_005239 [Caenorhabditis nigoni]
MDKLFSPVSSSFRRLLVFDVKEVDTMVSRDKNPGEKEGGGFFILLFRPDQVDLHPHEQHGASFSEKRKPPYRQLPSIFPSTVFPFLIFLTI